MNACILLFIIHTSNCNTFSWFQNHSFVPGYVYGIRSKSYYFVNHTVCFFITTKLSEVLYFYLALRIESTLFKY